MKLTVKSNVAGSIDIDSSFKPAIVDGDPSKLGDISLKESLHSESCIYCGARGTSTEHVIPFAWGGNLKIFGGSCATCQNITQKFEGYALSDGSMPNVRMVRNIRSRSDHKRAARTLRVRFVKDGKEFVESVPTDQVPLLLGFPWFDEPGLLVGRTSSQIGPDGWFTASVGPDLEKFLVEHDATQLRVEEKSIP